MGSDGSCAAPAAAIKQQVDPFIETKLRLSSWVAPGAALRGETHRERVSTKEKGWKKVRKSFNLVIKWHVTFNFSVCIEALAAFLSKCLYFCAAVLVVDCTPALVWGLAAGVPESCQLEPHLDGRWEPPPQHPTGAPGADWTAATWPFQIYFHQLLFFSLLFLQTCLFGMRCTWNLRLTTSHIWCRVGKKRSRLAFIPSPSSGKWHDSSLHATPNESQCLGKLICAVLLYSWG